MSDHSTPPDMSASVILPNRNNVWVHDNMADKCYFCQKTFDFFTRKHHCRNCGNIFCYACCSNYMVIPSFITDRPDPADYWNLSYYIAPMRATKERVCISCVEIIQEKIQIYDDIVKLFKNIRNMKVICDDKDITDGAKKHYFDHLRNIQYYLPNHIYTDNDSQLLYVNSNFFSGHSKYIVHLIKSIQWNSHDELRTEYADRIIKCLVCDKEVSCGELLCTRTCQPQLSCDDCMNILFSCSQHIPSQIAGYLFDIISNTPDIVILCHMTFFVTLIKTVYDRPIILDRIHKILSRSPKLLHHIFWFLTSAKTNSDMGELANIQKFLGMIDQKILKKMNSDYIFFRGIITHISDVKQYIIEHFDQFKPIALPYDPSYEIISVDLESITVKQSCTRPTIIKFGVRKTDDADDIETITLLFKNESVMNDVTVLNLMTLSDIILKEYMDEQFDVVIYPTMPITSVSGMIQIVQDAETIHEISIRGTTILQHIMANNETTTVSDILDKYMYSLVSYTIQSYFIGLGDRHMENIMITDDGRIFHIDFGFILGKDVYPTASSDIKLNSEMIDAIGGCNGSRYKKYLDLCAAGVILLRKYHNMFFMLLTQYPHFDRSFVENFISTRFQPRQPDIVMVEELFSIIRRSNNAYGSYVRDFLHYHSQEKTIQTGLSKAIRAVSDHLI